MGHLKLAGIYTRPAVKYQVHVERPGRVAAVMAMAAVTALNLAHAAQQQSGGQIGFSGYRAVEV